MANIFMAVMIAVAKLLRPFQIIIIGKDASLADKFTFRFPEYVPSIKQIQGGGLPGKGWVMDESNLLTNVPESHQLATILMCFTIFNLECSPDSKILISFFERYVAKSSIKKTVKMATFIAKKGDVDNEDPMVSTKTPSAVSKKRKSAAAQGNEVVEGSGGKHPKSG